MNEVKVYETADGQIFRDRAEAEKHEAAAKMKSEAEALATALVQAGYSKEAASMYVRGWRLGVQYFGTGEVPAARTRVRNDHP